MIATIERPSWERRERNRTIRQTWEGIECRLNGATARICDGVQCAVIVSGHECAKFSWFMVDRIMRGNQEFRTY